MTLEFSKMSLHLQFSVHEKLVFQNKVKNQSLLLSLLSLNQSSTVCTLINLARIPNSNIAGITWTNTRVAMTVVKTVWGLCAFWNKIIEKKMKKKNLHLLISSKESLYTGEPMRKQKNLVILGYRVEFE